MDKATFLDEAPKYYAMAVAVELIKRGGLVSVDTLLTSYQWSKTYKGKDYQLLQKRALLEKGIDFLIEHGMVIAHTDHFGPTLYGSSANIRKIWDDYKKRTDLPFGLFSSAPDGDSWIASALMRVNETYNDLGVTEADFASTEADWAPLPLERGEPALETAIEAVDATIEEVRKDNGYAATHPQERDFVLENLRSLAAKLKEAKSISVEYVRTHGIEVLKRLSRRFKDATIDVTASAARAAIYEWLKTKGIKLIEYLTGG